MTQTIPFQALSMLGDVRGMPDRAEDNASIPAMSYYYGQAVEIVPIDAPGVVCPLTSEFESLAKEVAYWVAEETCAYWAIEGRLTPLRNSAVVSVARIEVFEGQSPTLFARLSGKSGYPTQATVTQIEIKVTDIDSGVKIFEDNLAKADHIYDTLQMSDRWPEAKGYNFAYPVNDQFRDQSTGGHNYRFEITVETTGTERFKIRGILTVLPERD